MHLRVFCYLLLPLLTNSVYPTSLPKRHRPMDPCIAHFLLSMVPCPSVHRLMLRKLICRPQHPLASSVWTPKGTLISVILGTVPRRNSPVNNRRTQLNPKHQLRKKPKKLMLSSVPRTLSIICIVCIFIFACLFGWTLCITFLPKMNTPNDWARVGSSN